MACPPASSGDEMPLDTPFVDDSEYESDELPRPPTREAAAAWDLPAPEPDVTVSEAAQAASETGRASDDAAEAGQTISPRAYQLEMLERSLEGNVIVVMDTGSGKTQVAVLRIKAELERADPDKIIWFLAPTVSLCEQQFNVIGLQVTSVRMRLLTGNENVDTWNEETWSSVLDGTRIIVSTYQVLLDALQHAFVTMDRLCLIIFDEAHNCARGHPGSHIMKTFYRGPSLPSVLGLTATPSMRSKAEDMRVLEATLNALCVSPTIHSETLRKYVTRPEIRIAAYVPLSPPQFTESMLALQDALDGLDIRTDPYILHLLAEETERNRRYVAKAIEKDKTYSRTQIKSLWSRCEQIHKQLGPWATDLYLWKASTAYQDRLEETGDFSDHLTIAERRYVADFLSRLSLERPPPRPQEDGDISHKFSVLLEQLLSMDGSVVGIVFAEERATVMMLCELLESCPAIVQRYRIGIMVGVSKHPARNRTLFEFLDDTPQRGLAEFRAGAVNLLVATSVLEEGIDVPACNLIVCFDKPANAKAFAQRRGRARMSESRLILLTEEAPHDYVQPWEALEEELRRVCEEGEREVARTPDEDPRDGPYFFAVGSTGATLDLNGAKQHLAHLCSVLSRGEFIDSRPDYVLQRRDTQPPLFSATVLLPPCIPEELRRVAGESAWLSEKKATKEVAFRAYLALYRAGLVDDHLLPLTPGRDAAAGDADARAPETDVEPPFDPWPRVADAWRAPRQRWLYPLSCDEDGGARTDYDLLFPVPLHRARLTEQPLPRPVAPGCRLRLGAARPVPAREAAALPDDTPALLAAAFQHRWPVRDGRQVARFSVRDGPVSRRQIAAARFDPRDGRHASGLFLVRDPAGRPFQYAGLLAAKPAAEAVRRPFHGYDAAPAEAPYLALAGLARRPSGLRAGRAGAGQPDGARAAPAKPYSAVLALADARVDDMAARHVRFGLMIPDVVHELEVMLTATELAATRLQGVGITDLRLVREAISARCACEPLNYERLEFLGDSILKYCTSIQAAADYPAWPEGYLTAHRDGLISNSRLCRAALDRGLAKFILTRPFTGKKWRPLYLDGYPEQAPDPTGDVRRMSTKTLADVVEALIGASFVDGGFPKAIACIASFLVLDKSEWRQIDDGRDLLFKLARDGDALPPALQPLEGWIGYSFRKKTLLIEAMTHGSYALDPGRRSYERLEFLGDAILDNIIVTRLFSIEPPLPHHQMHLLKTAMVNGDFLAFVVMDSGLGGRGEVADGDKAAKGEEKNERGPIWRHMRHGSSAIGSEQKAMETRHEALRERIREAMEKGPRYPWTLLARVQAKKFVSDLFEALLGAIWVDSGSMDACKAMVARFGILSYLERIVGDKVRVLHPKQELGIRAGEQKVRYDIDAAEGRDGKARYLCRVMVGEREVGSVDDGLSREEAQTRAADGAIRLLMAEQRTTTDDDDDDDVMMNTA